MVLFSGLHLDSSVCPIIHAVQLCWVAFPPRQNCPVPQAVHVLFVVPVLNVPLAQAVHTLMPIPLANAPLSQLKHKVEEICVLYAPKPHWRHPDESDTPAPVENSPARQPVHLLDSARPVCEEYVPGLHLMQTALELALIFAEYVPAIHSRQELLEDDPGVVE
jgi:hypothetical protein